jgi:hypothetical protein
MFPMARQPGEFPQESSGATISRMKDASEADAIGQAAANRGAVSPSTMADPQGIGAATAATQLRPQPRAQRRGAHLVCTLINSH